MEVDLTGPDLLARQSGPTTCAPLGDSLLGRTYDAIGFFGHLAASGVSPWKKFPAMFAATTAGAAPAAAVKGDKLFLNSEASVFFREPAFGPAWDQTGPAVPSKAEVGYKPALEEPEEAPVLLHPAPYADAPYVLSLKKMTAAELVLEVHAISGELRLHSTKGPAVDVAEPQRVLLCAHAKACKECPAPSPQQVVNFEKGDLAITAGPKGAKVELIPETACLLKARPCRGLLRPGDFPGTTRRKYENVQGECLYTPAMTVGENGYRYPVDPEDHHGRPCLSSRFSTFTC